MSPTTSFNIGLLLIPALLVAVVIIGIILFIRCWRGKRIDDHPLCGRCGYDLIGTPEPRETCPECGADLKAKKAMRIGNRKRRTGPAVASGLVSIAALALLVLIGISLFNRTNLNPYKPYWLLKLEATTPALGSKGGALDELLVRTQNGSLSSSQLDTLMGATLMVQADVSIPWDETWGDLFAELFTQGIGTPAQHEQYAMEVYTFGIEVRPRVRQGDSVDLDTNRTHYRGQGGAAHYYFSDFGDKIEVDGLIRDNIKGKRSGGGFAKSGGKVGGGTSFNTSRPPFDQLPIGQHQLTYTEPTVISLGSGSGPVIAKFDRVLTASFDIIPTDADDIELFSDAQAAVAMEAGTSIENGQIEVRPQKRHPERLNGHLEVKLNGTTAPFGYRILARAGDREWGLCTIARNDPTHNHSSGFTLGWPNDVAADRVDLIFRPDPDAARATTDVYRILDHEFVVKDVEVVRQP